MIPLTASFTAVIAGNKFCAAAFTALSSSVSPFTAGFPTSVGGVPGGGLTKQ